MKFALHTWTLDTTPLPEFLRVVRAVGWDAIELRLVDFDRAEDAGRSPADVIELVRANGLNVACVGVQGGWMFATGTERRRLLAVFSQQCARAKALGSPLVMSPADRSRGSIARAVASIRAAGEIAASYGVRVAVEPLFQADQFNTVAILSELLARAAHPACGLVVDSYHLTRSGDSPRAIESLVPDVILYVQFSDVPSDPAPGQVTDRLPAGYGTVPFREFFEVLATKGYTGYCSYEAPNEHAWARPAIDVAREALEAARAFLS
jgi:2-keto-myo-inositol isomerase